MMMSPPSVNLYLAVRSSTNTQLMKAYRLLAYARIFHDLYQNLELFSRPESNNLPEDYSS